MMEMFYILIDYIHLLKLIDLKLGAFNVCKLYLNKIELNVIHYLNRDIPWFIALYRCFLQIEG